MGIVFSLSTAEVGDMPLGLSLLFAWLVFKLWSIACFVCFENSEDDSGVQVILALIIDSKMKEHIGHCFFIDFFEVLHR